MTKRLKTKYLALFLVFLLYPRYGFAESTQSKINAGISHYKERQYNKAAERFLEAQIDEPDNLNLVYNLANSDYKINKFAEAIQGYGLAAANDTDPLLKQKAIYNIGNSFFRLGKLDEAVGAYKKALELQPSDMDAKFNLEFAREQLKKRNPEQKQGKKKQEQDPSKNDNEQQHSSLDKRDKKKPNGQNHKDGQVKQSEDKSENVRQEQDQSKKTSTYKKLQNRKTEKEEAEQWLRSLKENLKKFVQKQIREQAGNQEYQGKDW